MVFAYLSAVAITCIILYNESKRKSDKKGHHSSKLRMPKDHPAIPGYLTHDAACNAWNPQYHASPPEGLT